MKSMLRVRVRITNGAPIWLELEPTSNGEARVWLVQDDIQNGYATVFIRDLEVAVSAMGKLSGDQP